MTWPSKVHKKSSLATRGVETCKQYVMPPHELISSIFQFDQRLFESIFVGIPGDVQDYWAHNLDHLEEFPGLDPNWALPLRLYGDGADVRGHNHFELMTLLPVLGASTSTMDTRLLLAVRSTIQTDQGPTVSKICEVLRWSFEALRA